MVGDIDVTLINLFGGIPDEDFKEKMTESTWIPPKKPQTMSTPITEIPESISSKSMTQDSVPLPTPRLPIPHQEERRTSTSSSTHSDPPSIAPLFNINRANVEAAPSVLSLDEDEGIVNDDEYERAVHRIEKINEKMSILVKNWNEESNLANTPTALIEVEEFYRPYMDQYNARWKTLERLINIYVENFKETTPTRNKHPEHSADRVMPGPVPRTSRASKEEKIEKRTTDKRVPVDPGSSSDETSLKQGVEEKIPILIPTGEQIITTIPSTTAIVPYNYNRDSYTYEDTRSRKIVYLK